MRAPGLLATAIASLLAASLLLFTPGSARAQTLEAPRARQGYYLALGSHFTANQDWDHGRAQGVSQLNLLTLRLGQMLTRRFGLGLRLESGGGKDGEKSRATAGLGLEGQFNPVHNLALHAGLGLGYGSINDPQAVDKKLRGGFGTVYAAGASWDFFFTHRLTGGWSVGPTLMVRYLPSDTLAGLWICGGVQLAWFSGRPRNELVLPPDEAFKK